jgi:hypothetical protein
MNMETRHAMDELSASLVALTNHVEAGKKQLVPNGLANLRSDKDSRIEQAHVDEHVSGGRIRRE